MCCISKSKERRSNLNELLRKIYEDVLVNEEEVKHKRKEMDDTVKNYIRPYKEVLSKEEQEELSHLLFSTCYTAEKVGFEIGIRFMFQLLSFD